jgi:DNA (cytosine-5)-methyltransferase 1
MKKRGAALNPLLFREMTENPWFRERGLGADGPSGLATLELCAGAGGQALGFEQAGIGHAGLVELNKHVCGTLRVNRPDWHVMEADLNTFRRCGISGSGYHLRGIAVPSFFSRG